MPNPYSEYIGSNETNNTANMDRMSSICRVQAEDDARANDEFVARINANANANVEQMNQNRLAAKAEEQRQYEEREQKERDAKANRAAASQEELDKVGLAMREANKVANNVRANLESYEEREARIEQEKLDKMTPYMRERYLEDQEARVITPSVNSAHVLSDRIRNGIDDAVELKANTLKAAVEETCAELMGKTTELNGKVYSEVAMTARIKHLNTHGFDDESIKMANSIRDAKQKRVDQAIEKLQSSITVESTDEQLAEVASEYGLATGGKGLESMRVALHMDTRTELFDELGILKPSQSLFAETRTAEEVIESKINQGGIGKIQAGLIKGKL